MLDFIKGEVAEIKEDNCILENNSKGYIIFMPLNELRQMEYGSAKIYTRMIVREDNISLYGFLSKESRDLFDLLTSVSSVGPKVGLGIISSLSLRELVMSITTEDVNALSKAPGVGKKTAQRIILELKDKISKYSFTFDLQETKKSVDDGALDALISLGYNSYEAKVALEGVSEEADISEKIKYALKNLSK